MPNAALCCKVNAQHTREFVKESSHIVCLRVGGWPSTEGISCYHLVFLH